MPVCDTQYIVPVSCVCYDYLVQIVDDSTHIKHGPMNIYLSVHFHVIKSASLIMKDSFSTKITQKGDVME